MRYSMPPFLQVVTWSSVANMSAAVTKPALSLLLRPQPSAATILFRLLDLRIVPRKQGIHFYSADVLLRPTPIKEDVFMLRRQQSGADLFPARRHPACLPRAELPEAG